MIKKLNFVKRIYLKNPQLNIAVLRLLLLGFSSGSAFILVTSTIPFWFAVKGYSPQIVSFTLLASIPYCLKFIWAPLIDIYSIPVVCKHFGQRQGWALVTHCFLFILIFILSYFTNKYNLFAIMLSTFALSILSANQDIIYDSYRIETLSKENLAIGTASNSIGFRLGILVCGAGSVYLSNTYDWQTIYFLMEIPIFVGTITILYLCKRSIILENYFQTSVTLPTFSTHLSTILINIRKFINRKNWLYVVLFILFYKASDSVSSALAVPLLIELNYSTFDIATISKTFGILILILGNIFGAVILSKTNMINGIKFCGLIQLIAPMMFAILSYSSHNISILILCTTLQNFCIGVGSTAFLTYLSNICDKRGQVATEFSLLYSFSSFGRILSATAAGWLTKFLDWGVLFIFVTLFSVLFLLFIPKLILPEPVEI